MNIEEQIKIVKNMLLHAETQLLDYEAVAIETLLTAYEKEKEERERIEKLYYEANENCIKYEKMIKKEKEKNKRLEKFIENGEYTWEQKYNETFEYFKEELEKEKEKNKKLSEQNEDMKALFNIQASIAKELDFNTNEKMVKFKDEYYVPDTMAINANIGEPKTIELRYISATKYLTKFDKEE